MNSVQQGVKTDKLLADIQFRFGIQVRTILHVADEIGKVNWFNVMVLLDWIIRVM